MGHSRMKLMGALVACGCILGLNGNTAWAAEADVTEVSLPANASIDSQLTNNQADKSLQLQEKAIQARNQQEDQAAAVKSMVVDVKDVKFAPNNNLSESQLKFCCRSCPNLRCGSMSCPSRFSWPMMAAAPGSMRTSVLRPGAALRYMLPARS